MRATPQHASFMPTNVLYDHHCILSGPVKPLLVPLAARWLLFTAEHSSGVSDPGVRKLCASAHLSTSLRIVCAAASSFIVLVLVIMTSVGDEGRGAKLKR